MENEKKEIRPPVVTILGHVDHGKTTLLDAIRKTNIAAREHGGITQHIGAYQITHSPRGEAGNPQLMTFIDTPGHAVFEKMRSRGAQIADIAVLVVAANDGVKPQTIEAIKHIKAANIPQIVAVTKTDLPSLNLDKIKKQLQDEGVLIENFGGDTPLLEVAAPKNKGIAELLDMILLVWQLSPKPSLPNDPLEAVVVESYLDKNRGPIVTVIIKKGTLKVGQKIEVDGESITIKALLDDNLKNVKEAEPGKPVEILGFKKILDAGTIIGQIILTKVSDKKPLDIAEIIAKSQLAQGKFKVIIKADVTGSLEAILANLPEDILVVSSGVGEITKNDIAFAKITSAPLIAFNIKINSQIKQEAEREGVLLKIYNVVYELLQDLEDVSAGFREAKQELKIVGRAKIVASFEIEGKKIIGAQVTHGKLKTGDSIILKTASGKIQESKITSLKRFKKDVQQVLPGQDCGIGTAQSLDFNVGDIIESLG